jgi:hypothetical protein
MIAIYRTDFPNGWRHPEGDCSICDGHPDYHHGEFMMTHARTLRDILNSDVIHPEWELWPTKNGNLAVLETTTDHPAGFMRYYIGYIDMHTGQVDVRPGVRTRYDDSKRFEMPGYAEHMEQQEMRTVDNVSYETERDTLWDSPSRLDWKHPANRDDAGASAAAGS